MASTWKLTKKLKETHLSSAFLRGSSAGDSSRANTLVRPSSDQALSAGKTKTSAKGKDELATPRVSIAREDSRETITSGTKPVSASTNPALLRVKIYEITGLVLPEEIREKLPTWATDKSSTRPPPIHLVLEYDKTQIILNAIGGTAENPVWDKTSSFDVSVTEPILAAQVYARVVNEPTEDEDKSPVLARQGPMPSGSAASSGKSRAASPRVKDVPIASLRVSTKNGVAGSFALAGNPGSLRLRAETHRTKNEPLTIDDFSLLKVVGKGSFGKVMQVRKKDTEQIYALKTLRKAHIVSRSEVGHTLAERTVLAKINSPFIVPLKFSFQSPEKLYLVLAFVNGGELFHHLQREGRFDLNRARFYTAELLCALECLHEYNVIYRDLKPENILLDYTGHIALCDFGLCKLNMAGQEKTNTFCGTPEYLAPELLLGQGYTKVVDYWTLGVLFYEMLTGLPPFYDQDTNAMYHKILQNPLVFPSDMDPEARSLLTGLLERDPTRRLGVNGAAEIKAHPFFRQIDWKCLLHKKYAAPFQPSVASATDTSNFDQEFTNEVPMDSVVDKDFYLSESVQKQFGGWSYTNTDSRLASSGKW